MLVYTILIFSFTLRFIHFVYILYHNHIIFIIFKFYCIQVIQIVSHQHWVNMVRGLDNLYKILVSNLIVQMKKKSKIN